MQAAARRASERRKRSKARTLIQTLQTATRRRRRQNDHRPTAVQRKAHLQQLQRQHREERQNSASLQHKALMRKKRIEARRPKRYTYVDCLRDQVPVPTGDNGTTLFQALMVGGMTAITVTAGGVPSDGVSFLIHERWLYPIVFSISFLTRIYIGAPLTRLIGSRFINGRLQGPGRNAANALLGTAVSSPVTGAIVTLLFAEANDAESYADAYLASLSMSMPMSALVSLFVVGPLTKLVFHNRIKPESGLRAMKTFSDHSASIARMFGF